MSKNETPKPMDPHAAEGDPSRENHKRACWALLTLVEEVAALFPETKTEIFNYDQRNTALSVEFTTAGIDGLADLLMLVASDLRVRDIQRDLGSVTVNFRSSARTQDSRDSFGLGDAWEIMADAYDNETEPPEIVLGVLSKDSLEREPHVVEPFSALAEEPWSEEGSA